MTRKFRPAQCLGCKFGRYSDALSNGGGASPYCMASEFGWPVDLIGQSSRSCPDFVAKTEEVIK